MKFGVYAGPIFPGELSGTDAWDMALSLTRTAYESGFDGVFAAHHYLVGPAHQALHPLLLLARMSAEFPDGHLGTASYLLPFTHPVEAAEATALLDIMCGGRLFLGVGQGYRATEFESFGVPRAERSRRLAEAIAALRTLWCQEDASFNGEFFRFDQVTARPKPVQQPAPSVWVGADTQASIARTPDIGDGWIASGRHTRRFLQSALPGYRRRLDELGRSFEGVPMFRELHVATDSERAEAEFKGALEGMYASYARWGQPGERYDHDFATLKQERVLVGSPSEVIEGVESYRKEFEVPFMWFRVYYPGMAPELALDTIRMVGAEVIPHFR